MKRSLILACLLASGLGMTTFAQTAAPTAAAPASAPAGPAKIGIIAFQPAVFGTNEGQRDSAQLRQKFDPKQAQLKALNDEIDSLTTALKSQGDKLSDAERAARQRTIEEKQKTLQRNVEDAQNEAQAEMGTMYQTLAQKVYEVLQSYAQQNGYTMIVDISTEKSPILWASQATDVTQAVVQAYNAKSGVPAQPGAGAAPAATRPAGAGAATRPPASTTPKPVTPTTPK